MARGATRSEKSAVLSLKDGARVAVVADTHSNPHPRLHEQLRRLAPDAILHGGDIGDLRVLDGLATIAPLFAVRGNIDVRASDLPDWLWLDVTAGERSWKMLLLHIALRGVRLQADVGRAVRARGAELVLCGHSHIPFIARDSGAWVFNPGSCGPRRFQLPIVFGLLELGSAGPNFTHRECETGEVWLPPAVG